MLGIVLLKPKRWFIETVSRENNNPFKITTSFAIGWYAGFIQMGMGVYFSSLGSGLKIQLNSCQ